MTGANKFAQSYVIYLKHKKIVILNGTNVETITDLKNGTALNKVCPLI